MHKSKTISAMFLIYSLWFTCASFAQVRQPDLNNMDLEDLTKVQVDTVSGASKFLENSTDVPASVTVVTGDEIREFGYRTLADVLQSIRGFDVVYDRNYSYVGVRGFLAPGDYNARILFLLDGHRLNDDVYDSALVGTDFPVDISLIDRVEVIRGASSSVYGTGGLLAVINVVTKRGRDLDAAQVSGTAGSLRTYKGTGTYGARFDNGVEMLISGTDYRSHGNPSLFFPEFDSPQTNYGVAENADGDRAESLLADVSYGDFNIHVVDNSRTKQIPTASFGTVFGDTRTQTTDGRGYVDVQYSHREGEWDLIARGSYDWENYHGVYIYDYTKRGRPTRKTNTWRTALGRILNSMPRGIYSTGTSSLWASSTAPNSARGRATMTSRPTTCIWTKNTRNKAWAFMARTNSA
jgi:outer membrane receptor for ferrienterochelin and colicins